MKVELEIGDGVAHVVLNRPEAANTLDLEVAEQFLGHMEALQSEQPRVVVLSGRGGAFCAGGDVRAMAEAADMSGFIDALAGTFHRALLELAKLDAVVIAAVDGAAAGGGLGLALNADVRLATPRARFLTAYESVGLTPDSGVSYLLPRTIGTGRAAAMSATSRIIDATVAREIGLVSEVVTSEPFMSHVDAVAERLAQRPQSHMSATRRLMRDDANGRFAAALDAERAAIVRAAGDPSTRSLIHEFASRQKKGPAS